MLVPICAWRLEELNMSGINGGKSRFHRARKRTIEKRKRNRELIAKLAKELKSATASAGSKAEAVPA